MTASGTGPTPSARRRLLRRTAVVLATLLVGLALAELGLRVVLAVRGGPYSSTDMAQRIQAIATTMNESTPRLGAQPIGGLERRKSLTPYYGLDDEENLPVLEQEALRFRRGV